jgi:hypothetical protein
LKIAHLFGLLNTEGPWTIVERLDGQRFQILQQLQPAVSATEQSMNVGSIPRPTTAVHESPLRTCCRTGLEGGVALDGAAAAGRPGGLQVGLPGGAPERAAPAAAPPLVGRDGLVARLAVQVRARLLAVLHPAHRHQEKAEENRLFSDDNSKF